LTAGGGGGGLTIEEPENNIIRGAYYALVSALSGAQTMALCCYDEAYTIPSEKASRLSLRTMQILMEEIGLCDTVDPLGGSYYVETLTNQMEEKIRAVMEEVDGKGGIVPAIAEGRIQAAVSRQAYENVKKLERGDVRKVGVNCYRAEVEEKEHPIELHAFREEDCRRQIERLERVRLKRDGDKVERAIEKLHEDAGAGSNVMPAVIEAVKAYATVGEITGRLVDVYGRYREPILF
jgi:methylmalonyl-CoA mutase N-terminal domain/subunit